MNGYTLARQIADDTPRHVIFCAFTGKAALVLRQKGCRNAQTIHSLIYRPVETPDGPPTFEIKGNSDASDAALIIVDEHSMVGEMLGRDLLSFGTKILVLGDPAQLPPVTGTGFFSAKEPDFTLTEIHRQAWDNPIIRMSMSVRQGEALKPGKYGESEVVARGDNPQMSAALAADQVLVGRNVTRHRCNYMLRKELKRASLYPEPGDKLVCIKNNKDKGLLNGSLWSVKHLIPKKGDYVGMQLISEDVESEVEVRVRNEFFVGKEGDLTYPQRKDSDEFTYGYALTVHKAQGSQWDNVMIKDESSFFGAHQANHLYTALTRAAKKVTVYL